MENIKISYIQIDRVPINGVATLFFFTEKNGKIYWGTDNNSIDQEDIKRWILNKTIFKLKSPIFIKEDETLLIGGEDKKIYISNPLTEKMRLHGSFAELVE